MLPRWRGRTLPSLFLNMSSSELGFSAVRNPQSSAVFRIHAPSLGVHAACRGEHPFLVRASTFGGVGAVFFPNNISGAEHGSFLCRRRGSIARSCDLLAPALMATRGHAPRRPLAYLSFMAGDGVDCLRTGENRPQFSYSALTVKLVRTICQRKVADQSADRQSPFLTNSLYSPQAFFSSLRLTSRLCR